MSAPLTGQCPTCHGVGAGTVQMPTYSPAMSPRYEEVECDECNATGVVFVACNECGSPAIGWEDDDAYCSEPCRVSLAEVQRLLLEHRLRASLEVAS